MAGQPCSGVHCQQSVVCPSLPGSVVQKPCLAGAGAGSTTSPQTCSSLWDSRPGPPGSPRGCLHRDPTLSQSPHLFICLQSLSEGLSHCKQSAAHCDSLAAWFSCSGRHRTVCKMGETPVSFTRESGASVSTGQCSPSQGKSSAWWPMGSVCFWSGAAGAGLPL